tara:strand:- start:1521 stop:1733 length:213 start_codon:yes stop_codon:yes gene_type:complete
MEDDEEMVLAYENYKLQIKGAIVTGHLDYSSLKQLRMALKVQTLVHEDLIYFVREEMKILQAAEDEATRH